MFDSPKNKDINILPKKAGEPLIEPSTISELAILALVIVGLINLELVKLGNLD
tara:strand:- start:90 stop:248 length:159 start_codon:yes stop_codon:yes gene_type:complete